MGPHRGRGYNVSLTKADQCINERDLIAKLDLLFSKGWWHLPIGIRRALVGNQDVWKKTGEDKCNPSPPQHSSSNLKVLQTSEATHPLAGNHQIFSAGCGPPAMHMFKKKALCMNDRLSVSLWVPLLHLLTVHLAGVLLSFSQNTHKENTHPLGKWSRGANCSHTFLSRCSITSCLQNQHRFACLLVAGSHSSHLKWGSVTTH